jgi:hypothetical protein
VEGKDKVATEGERADTDVHFVAVSSKLKEQLLNDNYMVSEAALALVLQKISRGLT